MPCPRPASSTPRSTSRARRGAAVATAYHAYARGDQLLYQLAATGTYTIVIEDFSLTNTGNYNLSLLDIPSQ